MSIKYFSFLLLALSMLSISCGGDDEEPAAQLTIEQYIEENNLTTQETASGLHYIIKEQGVAPNPVLSSDITINYNGYFLNGNSFDSGNNVTFALSRLILGWQEGIQLIGTGGSITLLIPSELAYGSSGRGGIPGNTPLGFEIDLIAFQ